MERVGRFRFQNPKLAETSLGYLDEEHSGNGLVIDQAEAGLVVIRLAEV